MSKGKQPQSPKITDLSGKKLNDKDANRVKGGFNPQPDPPARWKPGINATLNPTIKQSPS